MTPRGHFGLGWNDSRGVILSWDGTTPGKSICLGMERLQGSPSIQEQKDSRGVILSWERTTQGESLCPRTEQLQGSHSVLR